MLKTFFFLLFGILAVNTSAFGNPLLMGHDSTENLVRLSLWYEGTESFNKSSFRPGAAQKLEEQLKKRATQTPVITEELAVALENLNI